MNVYGSPLQECSEEGYAVTGYTRSGVCENLDSDAGSHHICVSLQNEEEINFCSATGQPDWCRERGECHGNTTQGCDKKDWCVCQWAFERVVEKYGCEALSVKCDSTSLRALEAYSSSPHHEKALRCLTDKCLL